MVIQAIAHDELEFILTMPAFAKALRRNGRPKETMKRFILRPRFAKALRGGELGCFDTQRRSQDERFP